MTADQNQETLIVMILLELAAICLLLTILSLSGGGLSGIFLAVVLLGGPTVSLVSFGVSLHFLIQRRTRKSLMVTLLALTVAITLVVCEYFLLMKAVARA